MLICLSRVSFLSVLLFCSLFLSPCLSPAVIYTIWHLSTPQRLSLSLNICLGHLFSLYPSMSPYIHRGYNTCHPCNIIQQPSISCNPSLTSPLCLSNIAPISPSSSLSSTLIPFKQVHPMLPLDWKYCMWSQWCSVVFGRHDWDKEQQFSTKTK